VRCIYFEKRKQLNVLFKLSLIQYKFDKNLPVTKDYLRAGEDSLLCISSPGIHCMSMLYVAFLCVFIYLYINYLYVNIDIMIVIYMT